MSRQPFEIAVQPVPVLPGAIVVHVRGELDMHGSPPFKEVFETLLQGETMYTMVILNEVTFIDSHNIGAFVGAYQRLRARGGWIAIICTQPYVRRVFEIMNLDKLFRFYNTWDDFATALRGDKLVPADVDVPSMIENPPYAQPTSA